MDIFNNFPLWTSLAAILFAQFLKVPIQYIATKKIDWSLITSTGSMPSSHSAAVTALATSVGLVTGFDSPLFAVTTVFAVITMYDASGVRRQAGKHATILNQLVADFNKLVDDVKAWQTMKEQEKQLELKELLGHEPIEVFFGALSGIFLALVLYFFAF
jgi:acid phosphatase family membrane protein YuiD